MPAGARLLSGDFARFGLSQAFFFSIGESGIAPSYEVVGVSITPREAPALVGDNEVSERLDPEVFLIARARTAGAKGDVIFLRVSSVRRLGGHLQVISRELVA